MICNTVQSHIHWLRYCPGTTQKRISNFCTYIHIHTRQTKYTLPPTPAHIWCTWSTTSSRHRRSQESEFTKSWNKSMWVLRINERTQEVQPLGRVQCKLLFIDVNNRVPTHAGVVLRWRYRGTQSSTNNKHDIKYQLLIRLLLGPSIPRMQTQCQGVSPI